MPQDQFLTKYFTIFAKPKMYLTLLCLFLAFPLGLAYFVLLVVGFSLGFSLLIVCVAGCWIRHIVSHDIFSVDCLMAMGSDQFWNMESGYNQ